MLCFTDSSPSKENFLVPKDKPKFSYNFTSYLIYLIHYCRQVDGYKCSLLSAHNKLSTPNYDILKTEAYGPILASKRLKLLAQIFRVPMEKVLFFMDNLPFLSLVRNFDRNYLTYNVYFIKLIQELTSMGFLKSNFFYVGSNNNPSDILSRPCQMLPESFERIFGCYKDGQYDLNSVIFGKINVEKFIASTKESPGQVDTAIPGVYETRSRVFLNMAQTLTHFPNSFRGVQGGEPIHTLRALIGLAQCAKILPATLHLLRQMTVSYTHLTLPTILLV